MVVRLQSYKAISLALAVYHISHDEAPRPPPPNAPLVFCLTRTVRERVLQDREGAYRLVTNLALCRKAAIEPAIMAH